MSRKTESSWVTYNDATATYDTPDGTKVATELCDMAQSMLDVFRIAGIREDQRTTQTRTE